MAKRGFLERQGYNKNMLSTGFIILIIVIILIGAYFLFFFYRTCDTEACYNDAIKGCSRVIYIKEDSTASWLYRINGGNEIECVVEVTLLNLKRGEIDIEKLQGKSMTCNVNKKNPLNPETNIAECTGKLKEELQDLIIQRMHSFVLENLKEVIPAIEEILKGRI